MSRLELRARAHTLARRKRALVLLLLGVIFMLTGFVLSTTTAAVTVMPAYAAHVDVLPWRVWAWLFFGVGLFAAVVSVLAGERAWLAYGALMLLSSFWGLLFVASAVQTGYGRAWLGTLQWLAVSGVLAIISDWEDPPAQRVDVAELRDQL